MGRLKPIKENCPGFISYDQIHLVVAYLTGLHSASSRGQGMSSESSTKVIMSQLLAIFVFILH